MLTIITNAILRELVVKNCY